MSKCLWQPYLVVFKKDKSVALKVHQNNWLWLKPFLSLFSQNSVKEKIVQQITELSYLKIKFKLQVLSLYRLQFTIYSLVDLKLDNETEDISSVIKQKGES